MTGITATGIITSAAAGPNFDYTIHLSNSSTSSASIGTFWYAWIAQPFQDYLATKPVSVSPPTGWTETLTNIGSTDGYGIEYVSSGAAFNVPVGGSLDFGFTSADTPASVNGNSPFYAGTPVGTSFVYSGGPEQGLADEFVVAALQSITVTPANTSLATGNTEQFTATGNLSNNSTVDLTGQATWASSDITWATINSTGLATAAAPGPVTISAVFDGITGSTGLTVVPADPPVDHGDPGQYQPADGRNGAVHRHRQSVGQHDRKPDQSGDLDVLRHRLGHDQLDRVGYGRVSRPRDDLGGLCWRHR